MSVPYDQIMFPQGPTTMGSWMGGGPQMSASPVAVPVMPSSMDLAGLGGSMGGMFKDVADAASSTAMKTFDATKTAGGGSGLGGWLKDGKNLGVVVQGLGALTGAWLGYQNLRTARDQLNFSKEAFRKNLANQTQTYNTSLEDRIRGRTSDYAGKESDVQAYLARHSLK